jgi:Domain of Unknown Function (DUF1080).
MQAIFRLMSFVFAFILSTTTLSAQEENQLLGRWDLKIEKDETKLPSWLEIRKSGHQTLIGRFVYAFGSARPVAEIKQRSDNFFFTIPVQWEAETGKMDFKGQFVEGKIQGTMVYVDGKTYSFTGTKAPRFKHNPNPIWGSPTKLFNDKDLTGWNATGKNQWTVENGILISKASGSNLVTDQKFNDFKLHVEFRYPKEGNSGVYLRGRYEVQVADNQGDEPSDIKFGGVYGFLEPNEMVAKAPGKWQTYDITLIGNRVTVVANGKTIISDQTIPGITGGALDSDEGAPGPIMLQGDHSPVEYRNIVITPVIGR